jgi:hypothetical protein
MAPIKTETALKREDKVMTASWVLSPNSATTTSTNDAISGAKSMTEKNATSRY